LADAELAPARNTSTPIVAPDRRSTTSTEENAERECVLLPSGTTADDVPTTKIPDSALRLALPLAGKRPSQAPVLVIRKRVSVLDSSHLADACDSGSRLRAAAPPEAIPNELAVSEAPSPLDAPPPPPAPEPVLEPMPPLVAVDVLPHATIDRSSRRLTVILFLLATLAFVVLAIAAKSSRSSSHPAVRARVAAP
jgi:hypothetical protein